MVERNGEGGEGGPGVVGDGVQEDGVGGIATDHAPEGDDLVGVGGEGDVLLERGERDGGKVGPGLCKGAACEEWYYERRMNHVQWMYFDERILRNRFSG